MRFVFLSFSSVNLPVFGEKEKIIYPSFSCSSIIFSQFHSVLFLPDAMMIMKKKGMMMMNDEEKNDNEMMRKFTLSISDANPLVRCSRAFSCKTTLTRCSRAYLPSLSVPLLSVPLLSGTLSFDEVHWCNSWCNSRCGWRRIRAHSCHPRHHCRM